MTTPTWTRFRRKPPTDWESENRLRLLRVIEAMADNVSCELPAPHGWTGAELARLYYALDKLAQRGVALDGSVEYPDGSVVVPPPHRSGRR